MQDKKQQLELDMEQPTGSKLEKEYIKAVCCHPASLTYMADYMMWKAGLDNSQLQLRLLGEISTTSYMQRIPL